MGLGREAAAAAMVAMGVKAAPEEAGWAAAVLAGWAMAGEVVRLQACAVRESVRLRVCDSVHPDAQLQFLRAQRSWRSRSSVFPSAPPLAPPP